MRLTVILPLGLTALSLVSGCGPNCQATCNKLYLENECNLTSPGMTRDELMSECNNHCEQALDKVGDGGTYTPEERTPSDRSVELENDKQAALWMECVDSHACEHLDDGYCQPVW